MNRPYFIRRSSLRSSVVLLLVSKGESQHGRRRCSRCGVRTGFENQTDAVRLSSNVGTKIYFAVFTGVSPAIPEGQRHLCDEVSRLRFFPATLLSGYRQF